MPLDATSQAAAVGAAVKNVQFQPAAQTLPRKILIIGVQPVTLGATIPQKTVYRITSPEDAGSRWGFGTMIHRLAVQAFRGSQGIETWVLPLDGDATPVEAAGSISFLTAASAAGTVHLYVAGIHVPIAVAKGDTIIQMGAKATAAINADQDLPVTATDLLTGTVDIDAKTEGAYWGDYIELDFNLGFEQVLPAGVTASIVGLTGGAGTYTRVLDGLEDGLGTGDVANEKHFTDVIHGFVAETQVAEDLSEYNGEGNDFVGLYSKTVARPFRSLFGDVGVGASGLAGALAFAATYKETDRTNGIMSVPGSRNHIQEIAALAIGIAARIHNNRAAETLVGQVLPGIIPGALADQWTADYNNRDIAVKGGVSPTTALNGVVRMSNLLTVYNPASVPIESNGYRSMISISKIQNILWNIQLNFSQEKWQGVIIVEDTTKVANSIDRAKARDISAVIDDLIALTNSFRDHAWIFTSAFTIEKLQAGGLVVIRPGGTGFNSTLPVILSGEGNIIDTLIEFDTSIDVLLS